MNSEQFMREPDALKQRLRCHSKNGTVRDVTVWIDGVFCESCGEVVEKGYQLGSSDAKYCPSCFRKNQVDSEFK